MLNTDNRENVLVTGSSGLLGRPVCVALAKCGFRVFAFDREGPPGPPEGYELVREISCDVTNDVSVCSAVDRMLELGGERLSSVVHLAAYYDFSGEDSPLYESVTVEGTRRLLQELRRCQVEQFVFTSSMLVHKPCRVGEHISEDSPLGAQWAYPQSKIETERMISREFADVPSVFLRIAGVYTQWGTQPTLVQQIKRIYERQFESHFFPGDTSSGQASVNIDDTVDAILKTIAQRGNLQPQTAILIGEPEPPSYGQLQEAIAEYLHDSQWSTLYVPPLLAKAGAAVSDTLANGEAFIKPFMVDMADDHYALDISRAKQLLHWQPQRRLIDQLPGILQTLLDNPQAWYTHNRLDPDDIPTWGK